MKNIKNIIIISDYTYVEGGAAKVAIDTANKLSKNYNCIFVSPSYKDKSQLNSNVTLLTTEQGDCLNTRNKIIGLINGIWNTKFYRLVLDLLKKYSTDDTVINVHGWTKACSAYFFRAIKKMNFSCFLTLHDYFLVCPNGSFFNYKKKNVCSLKPCSRKCIFTDCDSRNYFFKIYRLLRIKSYKKFISLNVNLICVSDFQKKIIQKYTSRRIFVLENPFYFDRIINDNEKKYDFVFVGRTTTEKGYSLFKELVNDYQNCSFLLVGKNTEKIDKKNFTSTGWVSEEEVISYLNQSKCLIFPSLWPETFGLNVKKALLYDIPCIVSSNTYASSIIDDRIIVFEQGNYIDLKKKVDYFLKQFNVGKRRISCNDRYEEDIVNIFLEK